MPDLQTVLASIRRIVAETSHPAIIPDGGFVRRPLQLMDSAQQAIAEARRIADREAGRRDAATFRRDALIAKAEAARAARDLSLTTAWECGQ